MTELDKVRGMKGCKNCPGFLEYLGRELVLTAHRMHRMGEDGWQIPYERSVGVYLAIGLLRNGVAKDGGIQADIPPPPDIEIKEWAGGPRFFRSTFQTPTQEMQTNPEGRAPVTPIVPGSKRKRKPKKTGTTKKGFEVLSIKDLKKRRD